MPRSPETSTIRWEQDDDGVVLLTMDDPDHAANTMTERFAASLAATVDRLEAERDRVTGVVLTSAKPTFFAGADLNLLMRAGPGDAAAVAAMLDHYKALFRRLETLGRPVVAAVNGSALGGGCEVALACHHRIALDAPGSRIGQPEVAFGLLPGAGGVTRTVRMFGIGDALLNVLLRGQRHRPGRALAVGLVDEVVDSHEEMMARARAWIAENPEAAQPWDAPGFRIPGGTPSVPAFAANLPAFPANLRKQLKGAPMPAPRNILAAAVEGAQVDLDTAFTIETRYCTELICGQVSTNMIKAFFFDMQHIGKGGSRPEGHPPHAARKVAVLGAGMMGAGIAYACARAGMDVVLKDVSVDAAERGKGHSRSLLDKAVERGRTTEGSRDEVLARITPTDRAEDAAGADLVIEAVFESAELKAKVWAEIEQVVAPEAVLATNTSTLPVTGLAESVRRPENFVGMHFFSPVDKMPLLEIVVGGKTSDATLAKAFDVAQQIGKTPVVVNDSRGFFTSRVIGTFMNEAVAMLAEGVAPASVEQAAAQAGYPLGALALMDEVSLTLACRIREEARAAAEASGDTWEPHPADAVVDRMLDEYDRGGRAAGAGFYVYEDGRRAGLWPGLTTAFDTGSGTPVPFGDMRDRMLVAESLETIRCLDEGVLRSVPDANVGSLLGIGFPPWTGGVLQYVDGYPGGPAGFAARACELASRYGERFTPPASLAATAERGETYA